MVRATVALSILLAIAGFSVPAEKKPSDTTGAAERNAAEKKSAPKTPAAKPSEATKAPEGTKPSEGSKGLEATKPANAKKAAGAKKPSSPPVTEAESVEALVRRLMPSIVVIRGVGREGREDGLGTGFVIAKDLIATNLHVIGEGRAVSIHTVDGRRFEPAAVHAFDRNVDLAVLRVEAQGLAPLEIGDSDAVASGQDVVALGNPQGLEHSVVKGVVSGSREIDNLPLIQLAIPIEPGNSGGPVVDRQGRVLGVVTMKSQVTENLGFAVKINAIKPLLAKPNTVLMERWLTIGALDPRRWEPLGGSRWMQRAGRIQVSGAGTGFGGRSLCLAKADPPAEPFEAAVTVKLDDESGAAGIVFGSDGEQRHYGFYPSNGRLRLSKFDGPDVLSWQVIDERPSEAYLPGDWNRLRVQVGQDRVRCFVNGTMVFEHDLGEVPGRRVGMAKFRQTAAEFKQFVVAERVDDSRSTPDLVEAIRKLREASADDADAEKRLEPIVRAGAAAVEPLREQARKIEREAEELRKLAAALERQAVVDELAGLMKQDDAEIDLLRAALVVAKLDNSEVDVAAYCDEVDRMADDIRKRLKKSADDNAKLAALNQYLFADNGYHGSRRDYYSRSNSYLNEVIDDREGLPITLAVLYIEVGRRLGLKLEGVGLPGHFIAAHVAKDGELRYLDPFDGGTKLTEADAVVRSREITGRAPTSAQLQPTTKKAIVLRILENLLGLAGDDPSQPRMLGYLDAILAIAPDNLERRMMRTMVHYRGGRFTEALADVDYLLAHHREQLDEHKVLELRDRLERERSR